LGQQWIPDNFRDGPARREDNPNICLVADKYSAKLLQKSKPGAPDELVKEQFDRNKIHFFEQGYFFLLTFKDKYMLAVLTLIFNLCVIQNRSKKPAFFYSFNTI
jgi:hypothetical protein